MSSEDFTRDDEQPSLIGMILGIVTAVQIILSWIWRTIKRHPITMLVFVPLLLFIATFVFIDWDAVLAALYK